jgi:hypothetical protein
MAPMMTPARANMNKNIHPTKEEQEFLNLAYSRFFKLFDEIMPDAFWNKEPPQRLHRIQELFSVYAELLKYPPIKQTIEQEKRPSFADVGRDLFTFIRHVMTHFPFFDEWDEIWLSKALVNLYSKRPQFIDRYLTLNEGHEQIKYRFWEEINKRMTYVSVSFPTNYSQGGRVYLKDILSERDGIRLAAIFMFTILKIQIER